MPKVHLNCFDEEFETIEGFRCSYVLWVSFNCIYYDCSFSFYDCVFLGLLYPVFVSSFFSCSFFVFIFTIFLNNFAFFYVYRRLWRLHMGVPEFSRNSIILQPFRVTHKHPCQGVKNLPPYITPESARAILDLEMSPLTGRGDIFAFSKLKWKSTTRMPAFVSTSSRIDSVILINYPTFQFANNYPQLVMVFVMNGRIDKDRILELQAGN